MRSLDELELDLELDAPDDEPAIAAAVAAKLGVPPASLPPALGYAEFAGWVPGGQQVLVAREARGDGRYRRNYEVLNLASLVTQRQTGDPQTLGPFQRWQDPAWKRMSVSLR